MKRTFKFGKCDWYGDGKCANSMTVDVEYRPNKDGNMVFTASGSVWNKNHTDIVAGGQCLDEMNEYIDNPVFDEIYRLWKLYHLNDMHAECEHQRELGWLEQAKKVVPIYTFTLTRDALKAQSNVQSVAMDALKKIGTVTLNSEEQQLLALSYRIRSETEMLPEAIAGYYKLETTEMKKLGWLRESEHSHGILGKACPVCGYGYGTSWNFVPIPEDDKKIIIKLISTGALD